MKLVNIFLVILVLICTNLWINLSNLSDNLEIYFLDIGQGDSILIKTPLNHFILIDGGKDKSVLNELDSVLPYWAKKIDIAIATHPDLDHIGGLLEVSNNYQIDKFIINKVKKDSDTFDNLKQNLSNITDYQLTYLNDFEFDGINFDILWPNNLEDLSSIEDINDTSIAIKISYANFSFLTMGDLGSSYELTALEDCMCRDIDVLKLSHHGSKTSTPEKLLDITNPKFGIISAGLNNSYGHPNKEVLDRVNNKSNITIYRTDNDGRIVLTLEDNSLLIETVRTNRKDNYQII